VSLGLGIESTEGKYANFVTTGGRVLDSAADGISYYGMTIRKRGDANADGVITGSDYSTAKTLITNGTYKVFADCNADEVITSSDYFCIKSLM
jgi:hypothetical protein